MAFWVLTTDDRLVNIESAFIIGVRENPGLGEPIGSEATDDPAWSSSTIYCSFTGSLGPNSTQTLAHVSYEDGGLGEAQKRYGKLQWALKSSDTGFCDLRTSGADNPTYVPTIAKARRREQ